METASILKIVAVGTLVVVGAVLFWRFVWFFRNPVRAIPEGANLVSPADGTVVYVNVVEPHERVIVIKEGVAAGVEDIVREDLTAAKLLIGIFMSPFDVHYNRAPLTGRVDFVRHYPARRSNLHMGPMHFRTLFNLRPYYTGSLHIVENERTVTRIVGQVKGGTLGCYVVQIGGRSVHGIEAYVAEGAQVVKGQIFGMIRIGSQVDLVVPYRENMQVRVEPGAKVRAGESILVDL